MTKISRRIVELKVANVMGIIAAEIKPDGGVVTVEGPNAAGKTSLIESIQMAMGGKPFGPSKPLRRGEKKGSVVVKVETDRGPLKVTRTFTADGKSGLRITGDGGATFGKPQELLDSLVGAIGFDPFAFTLLSAPRQREKLQGLVGLDFIGLDAKRKDLYDARTEANREYKKLQPVIESTPVEEVPTEEVSVADLMAELRAANDTSDEYYKAASAEETALQELQHDEAELRVAERKVDYQKRRVEDSKVRRKYLAKARESLQLIDIKPIETRINEADGLNQRIRSQAALRDTTSLAQKYAEKWEQLTEEIEGIDEKKENLLADANWPVEGLGFDENGVTYNGFPFGQCSSAEQLRVSLAMGMAANPELRVLFIRNGSLMDDETMGVVSDAADSEGFQVWVERVASTDEGASIFIEDGLLVEKESVEA